ncbi:MAG: hypothetical protein PF448_00705 [Bacteroidales bacterium]|jgi:hypothetical protein|nr:hypothetical protein [Bacteroidales bacterium]
MKIFCFLIFLFAVFSIDAQSDSVKNESYPEYSFAISSGTNSDFTTGKLSDFTSMSSDFTDANVIPQGDYYRSSFHYYYQNNMSFSANFIKYNLPSKDDRFYFHSRWSFGLGYHNANLFGMAFNGVERIRFDSLTSENSTEMVFLDSVVSDLHYLNYLSEQLSFNVSFQATTDPSKRWAFYAGVSARAGFSINSKIKHTQYLDNAVELISSPFTFYNYGTISSDLTITEEFFDAQSNISFATSIPFGFDFRIGEQSELLRHLHLFVELEPGINVHVFPEINPVASSFFTMKTGINFVL